MDKNQDDQLLIIQAIIEASRKDTDEKKMKTNEKLMNIIEDLKDLTGTITSMMDQTNNPRFSPSQKDASNPMELGVELIKN